MKNTNKALFSSVVALLLCCTMLIGSTFAWFTDSVTAGVNQIVAGNLDVELYAGNDKVGSTTELFEVNRWEPGVVAYENLTVANEGDLALKYQLSLNFINATATPDGKTLADVLKVGIVTGGIAANATRDEALAAVTTWKPLKSFIENGSLLPDGTKTYGIVIYWAPSANDNDYNMNNGQTTVLSIELGVVLVATQMTEEKDSFGNDYDKNATWTGAYPSTLAETTLEIVPNGNKAGTITVNTPYDLVYLNKLATEWVSLYSNGQGTDVEKYYTSNGGKGTDYYYHWQWNVVLDADLDMNNIPMDTIALSYWGSFDGNGHIISNIVLKDGETSLFGQGTIKNLSIRNIVVNAPAADTVGAVLSNKGSLNNVHVVDAQVTGNKYVGGLAGKGSSFINCSIKDSTVTGTDKTVGGLVGYSIGDPGAATVSGNIVDNVTVTGAYNVGGLLGQSQNETVEGNTVKNVTVTSTKALPANASPNEVRTAEVAARSVFAGTTIGTNTVENVTLKNQ